MPRNDTSRASKDRRTQDSAVERSGGLADFLDCHRDGGFALMAVEARARMVTACLVDSWGPERVLEDIELRSVPSIEGEDPASLVTVVQLRGSRWSVVFKALADVGVEHVLALSDRAADLSAALAVEALVFSAEKLDGEAGYELWREGRRVERALWTVGDAVHSFESKVWDGSAGEPTLDLPNRLFAERGIHVPACRPFAREDEAWLAVTRLDTAEVERVDLIDLAGRPAVPEERVQEALSLARQQAGSGGDDPPSIFRSVLDLMGRVLH